VSSFEQLAEKPLRSMLGAAVLHEDIQHIPILIHSSPEGMVLASNREHDLIQMPCITTMRATTAQLVGIHLPEFQTPLPHRFRGHDNSTLCQKLFDIAKTRARSGKTTTQRGS
jgi:hypothetical protein